METLISGNTITAEPWLNPTDAAPVEETRTDPLLHPESEEEFEWMGCMTGCRIDWRDLKSLDRFVEVLNMTYRNGDWSVIQSKNLQHRASGRYVQVMGMEGDAYHVEVASKEDTIIRNWRVGLGSKADDAGNEPYSAAPKQQLPFAAVIEVLDSWLRGYGIPLGYGAALHVYG